MSGRVIRVGFCVSILLLFLGCIAEDPSADPNLVDVTAQMEAEGLDPGQVEAPLQTCNCRGIGMDSDCDYAYFSAIEVCDCGWGGTDEGCDSYVLRNGPEIMNPSTSYTLHLVCGFPTNYIYDEGYPPDELSRVTIYAYLPTGSSGDIYVDLYGNEMLSTFNDWQDDCDITSTSGSIQARSCDTEPLDSDQYLPWMHVHLPTAYQSGNGSYVVGFRLCYDHDGW